MAISQFIINSHLHYCSKDKSFHDNFTYASLYHVLPRGCPRGVMVKVLGCRIIVSEFKVQSGYYVHFQTNTLGKGMNPSFSQLCLRYYHCCSSKRMALALNNLQRLICHSTKKPNHVLPKSFILTLHVLLGFFLLYLLFLWHHSSLCTIHYPLF